MKIGIACDDYKVDEFKRKLRSNKFYNVNVVNGLTADTKLIHVDCIPERKDELAQLIAKVEGSFKKKK